jgi:hypothetical protein
LRGGELETPGAQEASSASERAYRNEKSRCMKSFYLPLEV